MERNCPCSSYSRILLVIRLRSHWILLHRLVLCVLWTKSMDRRRDDGEVVQQGTQAFYCLLCWTFRFIAGWLCIYKTPALHHCVKADNVIRFLIPPRFTSTVQPCDASVNKPLKERLNEIVSSWRRDPHALLTPGDIFPSTKRPDILE